MIQTLQDVLSKYRKKQVQSKKNMFDGFRPIFYFCRAFGLLPFSIVCNPHGEVQTCKVKIIDCLWFATSICACLLMAIFNYRMLSLSADHHRKSATIIPIVANYILQLLTFIFTALFFILNMYNRDKFIQMLKMFEHFDKEASQKTETNFNAFVETMFSMGCFFIQMQISKLNVHRNYKKEYRRGLLYIISSLGLIIASIAFSCYIQGIYVFIHGTSRYLTLKSALYYGIRFIQKAMALTTLVSFIILLNNLYKRFTILNSCLRYRNINFYIFQSDANY